MQELSAKKLEYIEGMSKESRIIWSNEQGIKDMLKEWARKVEYFEGMNKEGRICWRNEQGR